MPKNTKQRIIDSQFSSRAGGGGVGVSGAGSGGGVTDHGELTGRGDDDHVQYFNAARGDARYALISHDILANHVAPGADAWDVVGKNAAEQLTYLSTGSDGSAGGLILRTDTNGDVIVHGIVASNGDIDYLASKYVLVENNSGYPELRFREPVSGNDITFRVDGGKLKILNGAADYLSFVLSTERIDLEAHLATLKQIYSSGYSGTGMGGILLDFGTGFADIPDLKVGTLTADSFTFALTQVLAGRWMVGKSWSRLARDAIMPALGGQVNLYCYDFPGYGGFSAFEPGDDVVISLASFEETDAGVGDATVTGSSTAHGVGDGPPFDLILHNFEYPTPPTDPPGWKLDGPNNATDGSGAGNWATLDDGGNSVFESSSGNNTHAHISALANEGNYYSRGKFKMSDVASGVGITLLSKYCDGAPSDTYVRVRRYGGSQNFHVANHGYAAPSGGTTTSTVNPSANTWYRWYVEVEDDGSNRTDLRVRFWEDGQSEPSSWDIDCYWTGAGRPQTGAMGLWGYANPTYYDEVVVASLESATSCSVTVNISLDGADAALALITWATGGDGITGNPTGWSQVSTTSAASNGLVSALFYNTSPSGSTATWSSTDCDYIHATIWTVDGVNAGSRSNSRIDYVTATNQFEASDATLDTPGELVLFMAAAHDSGVIATGFSEPGYTTSNKTAAQSSHSAIYKATSSNVIDPIVTLNQATTGTILRVTINSTNAVAAGKNLVIGTARLHLDYRVYPSDVETGEQVWLARLINITANSSLVGKTAFAESTVVDLGVAGDGYYIIDAIDPGAAGPYAQIVKRGSDADPMDGTVVLRQGYLGGLAKIEGGGVFGSTDETLGLWFRNLDGGKALELSTRKAAQKNIDNEYYDGSGNLNMLIRQSDGVTMRDNDYGDLVPDKAIQWGTGTDLSTIVAEVGPRLVGNIYEVVTRAIKTVSGGVVKLYWEARNYGSQFAETTFMELSDGGTSQRSHWLVNTQDVYIDADRILSGNYGVPKGWIDVSFATDWDNYGTGWQTCEYKKIGDFVMLRGLARTYTAQVDNHLICKIPGILINAKIVCDCRAFLGSAGDTSARVDVKRNGSDTDIILRYGNTNTQSNWVSLEGICFSTAS